MTHNSDHLWNRNRRVGPREALTQKQVQSIRKLLAKKPSAHDLCLFMVAIDTMLRASNLLQLRVCDVMQPDGSIRESFPWRQNKSSEPVNPVLTLPTRRTLQKWIDESGKSPDDYIFTRTKPADSSPITAGFYRELIKGWVRSIELYPDSFSGHSLRRTKAIFMYERGVPIPIIGRLLGHKTESATLHYIGVTDKVARDYALGNGIFRR